MNFRKNLQHNIPKMRGGGVKGRLELFRKFIRFGRGKFPLVLMISQSIISYIFHNCSSSELEVAWLNLRLQRKQLRRWCWWTTWGWRACKVKLREWSLISSSASPEPLRDQQWMRGRTKLSVMTTAPWHNYYALKTTSPPAPTSAKYFHQTKHRHEAHKHFKSTSHTWHFKSKKIFANF